MSFVLTKEYPNGRSVKHTYPTAKRLMVAFQQAKRPRRSINVCRITATTPNEVLCYVPENPEVVK